MWRPNSTPSLPRLAGFVLLGAVLIGARYAPAQEVRSGGSNAAAMAEMQQLAAARSALQADNDKLRAQVAALKKSLDQAKQDSAAAHLRAGRDQTEMARTKASTEQLAAANTRLRGELEELIKRFRQTALNLKSVEGDRNALKAQGQKDQALYKKCVADNVALYQVGSQALDHLEHQGFFHRLAQSEPFTQLARARLSNLVDDYRYQMRSLQVAPQHPPVDARKSP